MASVRFELRVEEAELGAWRAEAAARDLSLSEFVRAAVGVELGRGLVAAGPLVVGAERSLPVTGFADAAKVRELRGLPGVTTAGELFAPVAPPARREVRPDPKSK